MRKPLTISDDRGTQVPLFHWVAGASNDRPETAALAEPMLRVQEATPRSAWNFKLKPRDLIFALPGAGAIALTMAIGHYWPTAPRYVPQLAICASTLPFVWIMMHRHRRAHSATIAATLLAYRRCASCGYSLEGAHEADDGCVQCPECAAAWKQARVGGLQTAQAPPVTTPGSLKHLLSFFNRSATIIDAHSRSLPLIEPFALRARLSASRGREQTDAILTDVRRETRSHAHALSFLFTLIAATFAHSLWRALTKQPTSLETAFLLLCTFGGTPMAVGLLRRAYRGQSQYTAKTVATLLIKNGVCPTCGADLDAQRQCSCGAVWPEKLAQNE
jgi:hypothetical protein